MARRHEEGRKTSTPKNSITDAPASFREELRLLKERIVHLETIVDKIDEKIEELIKREPAVLDPNLEPSLSATGRPVEGAKDVVPLMILQDAFSQQPRLKELITTTPWKPNGTCNCSSIRVNEFTLLNREPVFHTPPPLSCMQQTCLLRCVRFHVLGLFSLLFLFSPPVLDMAMRVAGAGKKAGAALGGAVAGAALLLVALAGAALLLVALAGAAVLLVALAGAAVLLVALAGAAVLLVALAGAAVLLVALAGAAMLLVALAGAVVLLVALAGAAVLLVALAGAAVLMVVLAAAALLLLVVGLALAGQRCC
ncbi:hypothetical protein EMCRGX_G034830 [Ephydatia muelleri]